MRRAAVFSLILLTACGGGANPSASPSVTETSPSPVTSTAPPETAKSVFCGHVSAHINTLLNLVANPSTEDDFAIGQMQDQIDEFRPDAKQKDDAQVAKRAKEFITTLQDLIIATETDGLQAAFQEHGKPFLDAIADANTFCGL